MNTNEVLKLALEALNTTESDCGSRAWEREQEAITALQEALAEQPAQQEPVAYRSRMRNRDGQVITGWVVHTDTSDNPDPRIEIEPLYTTPPAAPVQEQAEQLSKLGWQSIECPFCGSSGAQAFPKPAAFAKDKSESLYQRGYMDGMAKRPQPLTDEQISAMCKHTWVFETARQWVRAIEAAHEIKEKNYG